jgi:hypothetical protein
MHHFYQHWLIRKNMDSSGIPTLEDIHRISAVSDPVLRNLQITQCYYELSTVFARRTGLSANWCTFATWASKQAGQTIRKEDLKRLLERLLQHSPDAFLTAEGFAASLPASEARSIGNLRSVALDARNFTSAIERASDAVGRGNHKVFEEIGYEFARFFTLCLDDETLQEAKITHFCKDLRPGDPPEGQSYLCQAFSHYYQAMFTQDAKTRAELILLANIQIGYHEQTRLQPEIAESLDAGLISSIEFAQRLLSQIFPLNGWLALAMLTLRRLLNRPTALDRAIQAAMNAARIVLRETLTEIMMTISLPTGGQVRLGKDLEHGFPESLQLINQPDLKELLAKLDPTPDSLVDSGAADWANLNDRLHFIIDLFRCQQENQELLTPPFTPVQIEAIKSGKLPDGKL